MQILILNRRDIANPSGGGAEIYTHEIAKGMRKYGDQVTIFSSSFQGCKTDETIDGIRYLRRGNEATVHLYGFLYALKNRKIFHHIIDEFNGIGFFTFMLPNSLLLIHQLYREFWFKELKVAGILPYVLEPLLLKLYRKNTAITVSASTKRDLELMAFRKVNVVMNAITFSPSEDSIVKEDPPVIIFLGRLRSTKRPEHAIEIFRIAKKKIPELSLWIVGRGPDEAALKNKARGFADVTFWGWADEEQKMFLLKKAHLLIVPSVREGFGINVIEAASAGTPAIGYDVPGLRDSIRNGETGYLARSVEEAAERVVELLSDKSLFSLMSDNCVKYAGDFRWGKRVDEFREILQAAKVCDLIFH